MYAQQQQQQLRSGHSHKLAAYCRSSLSKMQFGTTHPTALATRLQARSQTKKILRGGAKVTSHCTQLTLQSLTAPLLWKWGIKPCCDKCDILGVLSRKWSQKNFQMKLLGARRQFGGNCRPCPFWLCHCTGASCNSNQMTPSQVQFGGNCPPPPPCPFWICHCAGVSCNSKQMTPNPWSSWHILVTDAQEVILFARGNFLMTRVVAVSSSSSSLLFSPRDELASLEVTNMTETLTS